MTGWSHSAERRRPPQRAVRHHGVDAEADIPEAAAIIGLEIGRARMVMRAIVMALDRSLLC